jgi:hypothetical protein
MKSFNPKNEMSCSRQKNSCPKDFKNKNQTLQTLSLAGVAIFGATKDGLPFTEC